MAIIQSLSLLMLMMVVHAYLREESIFKPNPAVKSVDVSKYLGKWYEVYSNKIVLETIQRGAYCATATYTLNNDGTIGVYNRQTDRSPTGHVSDISGYAYVPDDKEPGELKIHFYSMPNREGSYWILALGPSPYDTYEWAIVSDRFSLTLFVLARDVTRFNELHKEEVLKLVKRMGFWPISIYQGSDCKYQESIESEELEESEELDEDFKTPEDAIVGLIY